jgi:peptide/nickel transport system substrate-binding protein
VGIGGGTSADSVAADIAVTNVDDIRLFALYNGLVKLSDDGTHMENELAEEISSSPDARVWTVRLRPDVTFHNGKALTADDVIFTFKRIMNPKSPGPGAPALAPITGMRRLDARTVRITMKFPYASFLEQLWPSFNYGIVPTGYNPKAPVGTGPFKFQSFTPGQRSVFTRNPHYWKPGRPYLDQLTIIDFADDTAGYNALLSNQVDIYGYANPALAAQARGAANLKVLVSRSSQWTPFTMRTNQAPFSDVRVRQAFRLIVDRPALIRTALSGVGQVGNDVFAQHDPSYDTSLVRHQDIQQAKFLLKQAGREAMAIELVTAPIAAGVIEAAQVFAQQAQAAGVKVHIRQLTPTDLYGPNYLKWIFAQDFWGYNPYLSNVQQATLSTAPFNECHFRNARYDSLYREANATLDAAKQREIIHEMQTIDFTEGGYIIPSYNEIVDLMTTKVHGLTSVTTGIPVGGAAWDQVWLSA